MSNESEETVDMEIRESSTQVTATPWLVTTVTYIQAGEADWPQIHTTQMLDFRIKLGNFTVVLHPFCLHWIIIGIDIVNAIRKAESHLCFMRIVQRNKVQMS